MVCLLDEVNQFGDFKPSGFAHPCVLCRLCQLSPSWPPVRGISGNPHRRLKPKCQVMSSKNCVQDTDDYFECWKYRFFVFFSYFCMMSIMYVYMYVEGTFMYRMTVLEISIYHSRIMIYDGR